jgi:hypothetical protein
MDFGGSYRDVDRNWQTPTTAVTNQDNTQQNAYVNFNRLTFLPMTFKTARDVTVTPSAFQSNQNALVSFFDEGRVEHKSNSSTAKLIIPKMPLFDFGYDTDENKNTLTQRTETNDSLRVGASYSPTWNPDLIPVKGLTFRPIPNSITFNHVSRVAKLRYGTLDQLNQFAISTSPFSSTNLDQYSDENEARLTFRPWDGFSFNPTYRLKVDKEKRFFRDDEKAAQASVVPLDGQETPRDLSQTITASGNLRLLKWLDPRYNYSFTGVETNGLPTQSNTTGYTTKTITRNSQGEVSATLQMNQILPRLRPFNSLNFNLSYKLESGDSYENMPEGFKWRSQLWAGSPLALSTGTAGGARRTAATDRRTFRNNQTWQPLSGYQVQSRRFRPFSTMSLTNNFQQSKEDTETTGTTQHTESLTWPDLVLTMNDIEDFFNVNSKYIDSSRLVYRMKDQKTETENISRRKENSWGTDYNFLFLKKLDFATTFNLGSSREDNLATNQLASKTDTKAYSIQSRVPWRVWAFTPRYEHSQTDSRDSIQVTNDLRVDTLSLQIYGDISKPLGVRFGRKEIGLANRMILNSTLKWDRKRSSINPSTNYLDTYSAALSGDYTISQNFRMAIGGNFAQEDHHPDFKKFNQYTFGLNTTLTIQF